jgi:REP element-mobilizing transposase RayT
MSPQRTGHNRTPTNRAKLPRRLTPLRDLKTCGRGRAVRHPDCDYAGDIDVHLAIRADNGRPFDTPDVAKMVCDNVQFYCRQLDYRLYGLTLMPDHLHVVLSPAASRVPVSTWLDRFKSFTTHQFTETGGRPPLWQKSAFDHVLRDGEKAEGVLRYVIENPVRAGLVEHFEDWRWTRVFVEI